MATAAEFKFSLRNQLRETEELIELLENGDVEAALKRLRKSKEILQASLED